MDGFIRPLLEQLNLPSFFQEAEAKKRRKKKKKKKNKKRRNRNGNNQPGATNPPSDNTPPGNTNPSGPPPPPPPPAQLRVRRSIFSLSAGEIQDLTSAFNALKNAGAYDGFVSRHFDAMRVAHNGSLFLPWHRKFLEELETALLGINPSVGALPYWPWDQGSGSLWTDAQFGPDGDPAQNNRVLSGPFANWTALVLNAGTGQLEPRATVGLVRELGSPGGLPSASQVQAALSESAYGDVRPALEQAPLHNSVHLWVGGDMRAGTSPNDPIFFLHHCNVDRLWWQWQLSNGIDDYEGPTGPMQFLQGSVTPAQVFDIHARGYTYQ